MIHFFYKLDYPGDSSGAPMTLHARMFAVGEKFMVPSMQSFAVLNFRYVEAIYASQSELLM